MANIKTAISLQGSLFEQAVKLARRMKVSRSRLFALALEDFIQRHNNHLLLEEINRAHEGAPELAEKKHLQKMRHIQRRMVKGEW